MLTLSVLERDLSDLLGLEVDVLTDGALASADTALQEAVLAEAVPL